MNAPLSVLCTRPGGYSAKNTHQVGAPNTQESGGVLMVGSPDQGGQVATDVLDHVQPWMLLALVVGVLVLVAVVRATAKAARRTRQVSRTGATMLRTLLTAVAIGGAQWLLITHVTDWRAVAIVLGVPAFVTAAVLVRLLTVNTLENTLGRGGRR